MFSYEPKFISETEFNKLSDKINAGEMDYMWPWQVLDATILGYPGADDLFIGLNWLPPNTLDGAAAEEYRKAKKVYNGYKNIH